MCSHRQFDHFQNQSYSNKNTYQDQKDLNAQSWHLIKIETPTGGEIEIDYESDDYAKVQDKKANQMFELIGMGLTEHADLSNTKRLSKFNEIDSIPGATMNESVC